MKNDSKLKRTMLSYSKKTISIINGITFKHQSDFCCLNCLYLKEM